ncbi:MAG: DUF3450 domain-containing protein [Pseudomonadota bacterium]
MFKRTLVTLVILGLSNGAFSNTAQESLSLQQDMNDSAQKSQQSINQIDDQTAQAIQTYRGAIRKAESLEIYNAQLQRLVASQLEEIVSIQAQTEEIDSIETGVLPLMVRMVDTLGKLVDADNPFLLDERQERVASLSEMIDRADISVGEKYRRIVEAYTIEIDYGRTIEAYSGEIVQNNQPISVDILRIGRIGLYYQTLDGNVSGQWNSRTQSWVELDPRYRRPIRDGLSVARKQAPPQLLKLPLIHAGGA